MRASFSGARQRAARVSAGAAARVSAGAARPVVAGGAGWIGLTLVALAQALRGQPLLGPDAITLMAAGTVVAVAVMVGFVPLPGGAGGRRAYPVTVGEGLAATTGNVQH